MAERYTLKSGVTLDKDIEKKVKKIAVKYYNLTKKDIVVTSGTRSSSSQASAMYGKTSGGDKLAVYKDKASAKAILNVYDAGLKANPDNS